MLQINTDLVRQYAQLFQNQISYGFLFKTSMQSIRHEKIQSSLFSIAQYLLQSADIYETNDSSGYEGRWQVDTRFNANLFSLLSKGSNGPNASIQASYLGKGQHWSKSGEYYTGSLDLELRKVRFQGQASSSIWKEGEIKPSIHLNASATMSALSASFYGRVGNDMAYADLKANATVGALYAKAEAELSLETQKVDIGVGACAFKGEVEGSFNLFGVRVSVTGQGSVGSAELNMSYHHGNREWEFGSHLGFIVGTGFKVKVQY